MRPRGFFSPHYITCSLGIGVYLPRRFRKIAAAAAATKIMAAGKIRLNQLSRGCSGSSMASEMYAVLVRFPPLASIVIICVPAGASLEAVIASVLENGGISDATLKEAVTP